MAVGGLATRTSVPNSSPCLGMRMRQDHFTSLHALLSSRRTHKERTQTHAQPTLWYPGSDFENPFSRRVIV